MTITVELSRAKNTTGKGSIEARVSQGGRLGDNLLKSPMSDPESVKAAVQFLLAQRFSPETVSIDWQDRT